MFPDKTAPYVTEVQYQLGEVNTHHGQFNPGGADILVMGRVIQTYGQDKCTEEEVQENPTAIERNKINLRSYFNSRSYLGLGPDKTGPDKLYQAVYQEKAHESLL